VRLLTARPKHSHVLLPRFRPHAQAEVIRDLRQRRFEIDTPPRQAAGKLDDVKAVPRVHQPRQHAHYSGPEEGTLEFWNRVAALDLPKIPPCPPDGQFEKHAAISAKRKGSACTWWSSVSAWLRNASISQPGVTAMWMCDASTI
jgi:hypothetical protein